MAKSRSPQEAQPRFDVLGGWRWVGAAAFVLLLFYFTPLLSPNATIQWNAVDLHYPAQRYFAEHVKTGEWPYWTPFLFCGYPFLADPQVGAYYPLNWPFFLSGITPGTLQVELALHSLLALFGGFLLLRRLAGHVAGALTGAMVYALGGFFAAHSSHIGIFQGAALLPWLLYAVERVLEGPRFGLRALRWIAAASALAGCVFLAGHLQTGICALLATALYIVWRVVEDRSRLSAAVWTLVCVVVLSAGLTAVTLLPGQELKIEAGSPDGAGALRPAALGTLVYANALGVLSGRYSGGGDVTSAYLYGGILLLPLCALALRRKQALVPAVLMAAVPAVAALTVLNSESWFIAELGLALLASFGVMEAEVRFRKTWLGVALVALFALDLCQFNSWNNPLTYARASYEEMYGTGEAALRFKVGPEVKPPFRMHIPDGQPIFGSLNSPLLVKVETTGGFNPLELAAWREYKAAAAKNHRLLDGLAVALEVREKEEQISANPTVMARAHFAPELVGVATLAESRARLAELDPKQTSVVLGLPAGIQQDPQAQAISMRVLKGSVSVRYTAASPSLLRLSDAWYPGWQAAVEGKPVPVLRVNHALMGAVVPAGSHEVVFEFKPGESYRKGRAISLSALAVTLILAAVSFLGQKRQGAGDDGVGA